MAVDLDQFDHPAWRSMGGAVAGYLIILTVLTAALFVVPWLLFSAL